MSTSLATVATQLAIPASATAYTQAVSMTAANAAVCAFVILTLGGSSGLTPTLEGSNDLENWTNITVYTQITTAGYHPANATSTGIAWQYVRLKLLAASGGTIIMSATISTAAL